MSSSSSATSLETYARQAVTAENNESAIAALRQQGAKGLATFLQVHAQQLADSDLKANPDQQRLQTVLDRICQQRDCDASRLFWYTDLEQAKAAAQSSGKPILSLRLLGRLDQDLSCANSRFFRIALYPNAQVSKVLRDRFVLHWQSVRPVPRVTIDFGDGRRLQRTLTGNSIHYILDAQGRPVDALPGLYGPQAFQRQLLQLEPIARQSARLEGTAQQEFLRQYHRDRLQKLETAWTADLQALGVSLSRRLPTANATNPPSAIMAGQMAMTKARVEMPVLGRMTPTREQLMPATDEQTWKQLAQKYSADARLDDRSIALMRRKNPAFQVKRNPDPLLPVLQNFEAAMALDTVRNEYLLHSRLHEWLSAEAVTATVDQLNERVYAELFLTPNSDPWLGLLPQDVYSAIEGEGISK